MSALRNVFQFVFSLVLVCILSGCGFPREISQDSRSSNISGKSFRLKKDVKIVDYKDKDKLFWNTNFLIHQSYKFDGEQKKPVFHKDPGHFDWRESFRVKGTIPKNSILKINKIYREKSTFGIDKYEILVTISNSKFSEKKFNAVHLFKINYWAVTGEYFFEPKNEFLMDFEE